VILSRNPAMVWHFQAHMQYELLQKREDAMPSLIKYAWPCLEVILEVANNQEKITYGELADRLGLQLAQQEWNTVLDSVAWRTKRDLGDDIDLTWVVVYASGRAKGLGRYFSNKGNAPGSTLLDPTNRAQVADYERKLKEIYEYTYELQRVEGGDRVTKVCREPNEGVRPGASTC
jgi:hypothetical protein